MLNCVVTLTRSPLLLTTRTNGPLGTSSVFVNLLVQNLRKLHRFGLCPLPNVKLPLLVNAICLMQRLSLRVKANSCCLLDLSALVQECVLRLVLPTTTLDMFRGRAVSHGAMLSPPSTVDISIGKALL